MNGEASGVFAFPGAKTSGHSLVCFVRMEEECLVLFCHFFTQFSIFMCWLTFCHCWALQMGWGISAKVLLETIQKRTMFLFLFQPIGSKTYYDLTCARLPAFSRVLIGCCIKVVLFCFVFLFLVNAAVRRVAWTRKRICTLELPWHKDKEWESFHSIPLGSALVWQ